MLNCLIVLFYCHTSGLWIHFLGFTVQVIDQAVEEVFTQNLLFILRNIYIHIMSYGIDSLHKHFSLLKD